MIGIGAIGSVGVLTQSSKSITPPLSVFPGAALALSVARRLRDDYTGPALRVRRSSDNAEQDIGFTSAGKLDEAALTSFVGVSNGFVTTLYDQSGSNRNAVATAAINQPQIVASESIFKENGFPVVVFNGTSHRMDISNGLDLVQNVSGAQLCSVIKWATVQEDGATGMLLHLSVNTAAVPQDPRFQFSRSANLETPRILARVRDLDANTQRTSGSVINTALQSWVAQADYAGNRWAGLSRNGETLRLSTMTAPSQNTDNTPSLFSRIGSGVNASGMATSFWGGAVAEMVFFRDNNSIETRRAFITANQTAFYQVAP